MASRFTQQTQWLQHACVTSTRTTWSAPRLLRELCKAHGNDPGRYRVVLLDMHVMMCDWHGGGAAERDAVSGRVVIACRLRCLTTPWSTPERTLRPPRGPRWGTTLAVPSARCSSSLRSRERRSSASRRAVSASRRTLLA